MGQYAIYDVTPGETAELTFQVNGLETGESISNATLEIRSRSGQVMVPVKTITSVETQDGIVTVVATIPNLVFNLTQSETEALHPREPYYLFAVNVTTSLGRRQAIVPIGRLNPSHPINSTTMTPLKLGSATMTIQFVSNSVGEAV